MELVYLGIMSVAQLVSLGIFITVLIKMFKNGSALMGIIGILTCGLFTYIWGWMKCKRLALTKVMIIWTIMILVPFGIVPVIGVEAVMNMSQAGLLDEIGAKKNARLDSIKKTKKTSKKSRKRASKKASARSRKATQQSGDWGDKALALWQKDHFKDPNKAKSYLDKELAKNPSAEVYNNRGNALRELKQYKQALKDYTLAINQKPNFYKAYNNRGNVYFDQKNYQFAIQDYNKAISLNPKYTNAWLNRGLAYYEMKKTGLACTDLKRARDLGDNDGWNWASKNGICK